MNDFISLEYGENRAPMILNKRRIQEVRIGSSGRALIDYDNGKKYAAYETKNEVLELLGVLENDRND